MTTTNGAVDARPVLMSITLIESLGLMDRANGLSALNGIVYLTEDELLAFGASRVEWGEPDEHGWYTPTLYSGSAERLP